jgi:hypothetical protein
MSSCVPPPAEEQNELVVHTGLELRLRRLDFPRINVGTFVYIIDDSKDATANMRHLMNTMSNALRDSGVSSNNIYLIMRDVRLYNSILDIPKNYRSKGIVVCFREPSYNGRQALYHLFGERLGLRPYQTFVDVMEKTQKNGDAIVFGMDELMWYPGPKVEFPAEEIYKFSDVEFADVEFAVEVAGISVYDVKNIPDLVRTWVLKTYPETRYVNIQMDYEKDHIYEICGWNRVPCDSSGPLKADWRESIKGIKKGEPQPQPTPKFPEDEIDSIMRTDNGVLLLAANFEVVSLPNSLKNWIRTTHPGTHNVTLEPSTPLENGRKYTIKGWMSESWASKADWECVFHAVNVKTKESDTKAQLAAITESLKTLTAAVATLAEKA